MHSSKVPKIKTKRPTKVFLNNIPPTFNIIRRVNADLATNYSQDKLACYQLMIIKYQRFVSNKHNILYSLILIS